MVKRKNKKIKNLKNKFKKLSLKTKVIGAVVLLLIVVGIIIPITNKSYALVTDYNSYTLGGTAYSDGKGFQDGGYFYFHMAKNGVKWKSAKISIKPKSDGGKKDKSNDYYKWLRDKSRGYTISSSNTSLITVDSSASSAQRSFNNNPQTAFEYLNPKIKVMMPKGYKIASSSHKQPNIGTCDNGSTGRLLNAFVKGSKISNKTNNHLLTTSVVAKDQDRWLEGYFGINIAETAVWTARHCNNGKYYRHWDTLNVNIVPNTTTITFNANGGSGAPANQTKTYDQELTLSSTTPTKTDYVFDGWNTKADGSGIYYASGQKLNKTDLPEITGLTLYAQWKQAGVTTVTAYAGLGTIPATTGWNGSGKQSSKVFTYNTAYGTLPTPTREGATFAGWSYVPQGFQQLDYIQSDGSHCINTYYALFSSASNHEIIIDFSPTSLYNYNTIWGTDYDADTFESWVYSDGKLAARYNSVRYGTDNTISANSRYLMDLKKEGTTLRKWVNGTSYGSNTVTNKVTDASFEFFSSGADFGKYKLYGASLYKDDTLVKNFIPCINENKFSTSGVETYQNGLYDTVEKRFYRNNCSTSKEFTKGSNSSVTSSTVSKIKKDHNIYAHWNNISYAGISGSCAWDIDSNGKMTIYPLETDTCTLGPSNGSASGVEWYEYRTQVTNIEVKPGVKANKYSDYLFNGMTNLTSIDITNLDVSNTSVARYMFADSSKLKSIDLSNFGEGNTTNITGMFSNCTSLESIDLSNFNIASVPTYLFRNVGMNTTNGCQITINNTFPKNYSYDTFKTNSSYYFPWEYYMNVDNPNKIYTLIEMQNEVRESNNPTTWVPVYGVQYDKGTGSSVIGTPNPQVYRIGTNIDTNGYNATKESSLLDSWNTASDGTGTTIAKNTQTSTTYGTQYSTTGLTNGIVTLYAQYTTPGNCAWNIDANGKLTIYPENTDTCTLGASTFTSDIPWYSSRASVTSVVVEPGVYANAKSKYLFSNLSNATTMDVSNLNTSNVENMGFMFNGCTSLTELDLSNFITSNAINMDYMFAFTRSLTELYLSSFDTSSVTSMQDMFYECNSLTELDLSSFDTSSVTDMSCMFMGCDKLEILDLSNFNMSNVVSVTDDFAEGMLEVGKQLSSGTELILNDTFDFYYENASEVDDADQLGFPWNFYAQVDESGDITGTIKTLSEMKTIVTGSNTPTTWVPAYGVKFDKGSGSKVNGDPNPKAFRIGTNFNTVGYSAIKSGNVLKNWNSKSDGTGTEYAKNSDINESYGAKYSTDGLTNGVKTIYAQYEAAQESGPFGTCTWAISTDGKLSIFPENTDTCTLGASSSYSKINSNIPWYSSRTSVTSVMVEPGVNANTQSVGLFYNLNNATEIDVTNLKTDNVISMGYMFEKCYKLETITGLENFNTNNVTGMSDMFMDCDKLEVLNLSNFDMSNVTYLVDGEEDDGMLLTGKQLVGGTKLILNNTFDFRYSLAEDVDDFDNLVFPWDYWAQVDDEGNITNTFYTLAEMSEMVIDSDAPTTWVPVYKITFDKNDGDSVRGKPNPKVVRVGDVVNTVGYNATKPNENDVNYKLDSWNTDPDGTGDTFTKNTTSGVAYGSSYSTTGLSSGNLTLYAQYTIFDGIGPFPFGTCAWEIDEVGQLSIYPENGDTCILGASTDSDDIPWYQYRTSVTSVMVEEGVNANAQSSYLFSGLSNATEMDVLNLDTENATNMSNMFSNCSKLEELDLSTFNTSNVTNMSSMFESCVLLTSVNLSTFDTENVTNVNSMFKNCNSFETLDLSNLDMSNTTSGEMLDGIGSSNKEGCMITFNNTFDNQYGSDQGNGLDLPWNYYVQVDDNGNITGTIKTLSEMRSIVTSNNDDTTWVPAYTITYDKGSGSSVTGTPNPNVQRIGTNINTIGYSATKPDKSLKNWNTKLDESGVALEKNMISSVSYGDNYTATGLTNGNITLYAQYKDPIIVDITSTNNVDDEQTATLTCTGDADITGYYWGTTAPTASSTFTTVSGPNLSTTKTIDTEGTYYLACKDAENNIVGITNPISKTFYKTTLNMTNGTITPTSVITMDGNSFNLPTPTASTGYQNEGKWYTNSTMTEGGTIYGSSYSPNSTKTLYTKANLITLDVSVSVSFTPPRTNDDFSDIKIQVKQNDAPYRNDVSVNSSGHTVLNDLPKINPSTGSNYTYTIETNNVTGYTKSITGNQTNGFTVSYNDVDNPTDLNITSTNNVDDEQTVTLTCNDTVGVAGYYFGTTAPTSTSTFKNVTSTKNLSATETVDEAGTYYFACKDEAGNTSGITTPVSKTFYKTTLNMTNGTVNPASVITMAENSFSLPTPSANTDYTVEGNWYTNSEMTQGKKAYGTSYEPSGNIILYSKAIPNSFTVGIAMNVPSEKDLYKIGDTITYNVVVTNGESYPITNVVVEDPNATIQNGEGYTVSGGKATIPNIPAGGSVTVTVTKTIGPNDVDTFVNTATISSATAGDAQLDGTPSISKSINIQSLIKIANTIEGNMAEPTDYFKVKVIINGTVGDKYTISGQSYTGADKETTYTVKSTDNYAYIFLKHGETITIGDGTSDDKLSSGTSYSIEETQNDYETYINGSTSNNKSSGTLTTSTTSNTNTVTIKNVKGEPVQTGINLKYMPFIIVILVGTLSIIGTIIFKRKFIKK